MLARFAPSLAFALLFTTGCDRGESPSIQPEPLDPLVLHDSYGALMVAMLTALRTGDVAAAQASIATPGQIETMCPGYTVSPTPYTPPSVEVASNHCREVFSTVTDEVLEQSLIGPYGRDHEPEFDTGFQTHWRERCPAEFQVYQIWGVFEGGAGEGAPQAGFEVSDIFAYQGRWGLMSIPRCRGDGE